MEEEATSKTLKRTVKDSVFTDLFGQKRYLMQLYRSLHPEDAEADEDDITIVTLQNVITDGLYNDLGFMVRDRLVVLVEAQSTWSPNIVIRVLMYLMSSKPLVMNLMKARCISRRTCSRITRSVSW